LLRYSCEDRQIRDRFELLPRAEVSFRHLSHPNSLRPLSLLNIVGIGSERPLEGVRGLRCYVLEVESSLVGDELSFTWTYSENLHRNSTVERLAREVIECIKAFIQHCQEPDVCGYTPSDFPLAGLDQRQLNLLLGSNRNVEDVYSLSPMQEGMLYH